MDLLGRLCTPLDDGLVLGSGVIVSHLDANVTGIPSAVLQRMPRITLAATGDDEVFQIDPGLADQVGSLIIVEHRDFQTEVIGGFVDCETKFLIPGRDPPSAMNEKRREASEGILPFRGLTTSQVCFCFLGFFAESCSAVRVLFPHRLPIGEVLCAVDDGDQRADGRTVDGHVGEDARGVVHGHSRGFRHHFEGSCRVNPAKREKKSEGGQEGKKRGNVRAQSHMRRCVARETKPVRRDQTCNERELEALNPWCKPALERMRGGDEARTGPASGVGISSCSSNTSTRRDGNVLL